MALGYNSVNPDVPPYQASLPLLSEQLGPLHHLDIESDMLYSTSTHPVAHSLLYPSSLINVSALLKKQIDL